MRPAGRRIALLAVLVLALSTAIGQSADEARTPEPTEEDRQAAEETQRIIQDALKERRIIRSLQMIDGRYQQYTGELSDLQEEEKRLAVVIEDIKRQYERTQADQQVAKHSAAGRLAALYKLYRGSGVEYLFSAAGALDFVKRYRYALYVVRGDVTSIERYAQSLEAMETQHRALVARQEEVRDLVDRIQHKRRQADVTRRQHRDLLAEIRTNKELYEIEVSERTRDTREIEKNLDDLARKTRAGGKKLNFLEIKGYLDPPVRGTIIGTFGKKVHDRFKTVTYNRGIDIAAPAGTPVRVVFDGEVQLIQDFLAYGRVVIVDHGERYHSLYAHIEDPRVKPGQSLRRGEIIGLVGQTVTQDQPLLHFEIRHQGKAQNPGEWLFLDDSR